MDELNVSDTSHLIFLAKPVPSVAFPISMMTSFSSYLGQKNVCFFNLVCMNAC